MVFFDFNLVMPGQLTMTSEGADWLLIFVLASWRPPISGFLFGAFRGLKLVGAV